MKENVLEKVLEINKKTSVSEEELFSKIEEFLKKEKSEYPNFALVTMVMDSFETGSQVFKVRTEIDKDSEPLCVEFEEA